MIKRTEYRGSYKGLYSYNRKSKRKKSKGKKLLIILIIGIVLMAISVVKFKKENINLSDEIITYYIKTCDEGSADKLQVNWQEVAAIDAVINKGNFGESNETQILNIMNSFYNLDENGVAISVKKFGKVLDELKLSGAEKEKATVYKSGIKDNLLDGSLLEDKKRMDFIEDVREGAYKNYETYGVLPSISLAQAILESGWGDSELASRYNNLFGIKADPSWSGNKVKMETKENYDDTIDGYFRVYKNKAESIRDHGEFLYENRRYKENGVFNTKTYIDQAKALEKAGYSTVKDKNGNGIYANLLISVIQNNNLMLLDTEAQRE